MKASSRTETPPSAAATLIMSSRSDRMIARIGRRGCRRQGTGAIFCRVQFSVSRMCFLGPRALAAALPPWDSALHPAARKLAFAEAAGSRGIAVARRKMAARARQRPKIREKLAEREGFEPPIRLPVCRISSAVLSTAQPPLRSPIGPQKALIGRRYLPNRRETNKGRRAYISRALRIRHQTPRLCQTVPDLPVCARKCVRFC